MQSSYDEIRQLDAELMAISVDSVEENRDLAEKEKLTFKLLSDEDLAVTDSFGLRHTGAAMDGGDIARPAVFIVDGDGKIAWRSVTDNYRIRIRPEAVIEQLRAIR